LAAARNYHKRLRCGAVSSKFNPAGASEFASSPNEKQEGQQANLIENLLTPPFRGPHTQKQKYNRRFRLGKFSQFKRADCFLQAFKLKFLVFSTLKALEVWF